MALQHLPWLSDFAALGKLLEAVPPVGGPDRWKHWSARLPRLVVVVTSYYRHQGFQWNYVDSINLPDYGYPPEGPD